MIQRLFLFLILIFGLVACNRDVNVQPNGDGTATVSVSVTEAEVNTVVQNALSARANPLLRNPSVGLQNGQIVVTGEHERRDGAGTVSGTVTLNATVVNGVLNVEVTDVDIEGWDVSDERIQQFNDELEERLGGRARQNNGNATLESVSITDDNLTIQIRVSR
jgi:regulator of protease activity HflC (stomatin/prohibitin superfamily)